MNRGGRRPAARWLALLLLGGCADEALPIADPSSAQRVRLGFDEVQGDPGHVFPGRDNIFAIAWADLDGDGWLDLATGPAQIGGSDALSPGGGQLQHFTNVETELVLGDVIDPFPPATSEAVPGIAWADYDGDGDSDLALGYHSFRGDFQTNFDIQTGPLIVLENQGGTLVPVFESPVDERRPTRDVDWGDLDHDGLPELVEGTEEGLWLWRDLSTAPVSELLAEGRYTDVEWVDLDGDGWLDLSAASDQGVLVLTNVAGTLDLTDPRILLEGTPVQRCVWGDWLDEGLPHPALVTEDAVRVYRNLGDELQERLVWTKLLDEPRAVAWADFDSDGDLDLAIGWSGGTVEVMAAFDSFTGRLLESQWVEGNETLEAVVTLSPGDWDGDGDPDLAVGRVGSDQPYKVSGIYKSLETSIGDLPTELSGTELASIADWDGDGDQDVLAAYNVYDSRGGQALGAHGVVFLAPNDVDGLRMPDVFPSFEFPESTEMLEGVQILGMAAADRDADGDPDLGLATNFGIVHLDNLAGTLVPSWFEPDGQPAVDLAYADVDQDGDLDVAAWSGEHVRLIENNGGSYSELWSRPLGQPYTGTYTYTGFYPRTTGTLDWAQLDGDGRLQLVAAGGFGTALYILESDLDDPTGPWKLRELDRSINSAKVWPADFDQDGRDELLVGGWWDWQGAPSSPDRILAIEGDRVEVIWTSPIGGSFTIETADFDDVDGDGTLDFIASYGSLMVLFTQHDGTWIPDASRFDAQPRASFFDYDGDGDSDILWYTGIGVGSSVSIGPNGRGGSDLLASNPPRIQLRWAEGFRGPRFSEGTHRTLQDGPVDLLFTVYDKERDPLPRPRFEFRDWGGSWRPATVTGVPDRLESAPFAEGGITYSASWDWVADGADGEDVQLRAIVTGFSQTGGELRTARTTARTNGRRLFLDTDGDGVRDTTDPCPIDPDDDGMVPGVCDSEALENGCWCSTGGRGSAGWLWLLAAGAAWRRRRP